MRAYCRDPRFNKECYQLRTQSVFRFAPGVREELEDGRDAEFVGVFELPVKGCTTRAVGAIAAEEAIPPELDVGGGGSGLLPLCVMEKESEIEKGCSVDWARER